MVPSKLRALPLPLPVPLALMVVSPLPLVIEIERSAAFPVVTVNVPLRPVALMSPTRLVTTSLELPLNVKVVF